MNIIDNCSSTSNNMSIHNAQNDDPGHVAACGEIILSSSAHSSYRRASKAAQSEKESGSMTVLGSRTVTEVMSEQFPKAFVHTL